MLQVATVTDHLHSTQHNTSCQQYFRVLRYENSGAKDRNEKSSLVRNVQTWNVFSRFVIRRML